MRIKKCSGCGQEKPFAAFYRDARKRIGLTSRCKTCMDEYARQPAAKERQRVRRNDTSFKTYHTVRARADCDRHKGKKRALELKARYGLDLAVFDKLLEEQQGRCPICAVCLTFGRGASAAHVDHDHETGRVRGLLCSNCNRGLGCFKDSPEALTRALQYLKENTDG